MSEQELVLMTGNLGKERAAADKVRRKLESLNEAIQAARQLGVITTVRAGKAEVAVTAGIRATFHTHL